MNNTLNEAAEKMFVEFEKTLFDAYMELNLANAASKAHSTVWLLKDKYHAQFKSEQKQVLSDEEIEKMAIKEYPMQSPEDFYTVERDLDFMYEDYVSMILKERSNFRKGFNSALQYAPKASAGVWVNASERLPNEERMFFIRNIDTKHGGMIHALDLKAMTELNNVEWLDESLQYSAGDGWIDVKDTPKENGYYVCWCIMPDEPGLIHYHKDTGWQNGFYNHRVTHYRLIKPPINK